MTPTEGLAYDAADAHDRELSTVTIRDTEDGVALRRGWGSRSRLQLSAQLNSELTSMIRLVSG